MKIEISSKPPEKLRAAVTAIATGTPAALPASTWSNFGVAKPECEMPADYLALVQEIIQRICPQVPDSALDRTRRIGSRGGASHLLIWFDLLLPVRFATSG